MKFLPTLTLYYVGDAIVMTTPSEDEDPEFRNVDVYPLTHKYEARQAELEQAEPVPCMVLDPFAGSGTTLAVARKLGRSAIGIDISREYKKLASTRAMLNTRDVLSWAEEKT